MLRDLNEFDLKSSEMPGDIVLDIDTSNVEREEIQKEIEKL